MPPTFTPEELVSFYSQRVEQQRAEWLGNDLAKAEAIANPDVTGDALEKIVSQHESNMKICANAYDVAKTKLDAVKAQLPKEVTEAEVTQ